MPKRDWRKTAHKVMILDPERFKAWKLKFGKKPKSGSGK